MKEKKFCVYVHIFPNGKRYDEDAHEFKRQTKRSKNKIKCEIDGIQFNTQADLAKYIKENKATLWAWFAGKNPMPEKYVKRGIKIIE